MKNLMDTIGNTPLIDAGSLLAENLGQNSLSLKLEYFNAGGSVKDRAVKSMIEAAEANGKLKKGGLIVEATSGNTGIALAMICAHKGYRLILTMPESMSITRRKLLAAYGAELMLTPAGLGMQGAVEYAQKILSENPGAFITDQFNNEANPAAHYRGTAPEIWQDSQGKIDILVLGFGTGGTISGCAKRLKELNPQLQVIAVEPAESPLLSEGRAGGHAIQGIGANFIPSILRQDLIDRVIAIPGEQAIATAEKLAKKLGILSGISGGAAVAASLKVAEQVEQKSIISLIPDGGERYLD